jgi:hypothetical protein
MFDFLSEERPPPIEGKGEHGPIVLHRVQPDLCETYAQVLPFCISRFNQCRDEIK